jgi:hypothetical protein
VTNKNDAVYAVDADTTKHAATQDVVQSSADAAANNYIDTMQGISSNHDQTSEATAAANIPLNDDDVTQTTPSRRRRRKHRQSTPTIMASAGSNKREQQDEKHISVMKPLGALRLKPLQQHQQQQQQPVAAATDDLNSQSLLPSGVELNKSSDKGVVADTVNEHQS